MDNSIETIQLFRSLTNHIQKAEEPEDYLDKVLGIIFLKYLSDTFDESRTKLLAGSNGKANPENPFEFTESGALYLPPKARWNFLKQNSTKPTIGSIIDEAIKEIQNNKPNWSGCLPDGYTNENVKPGQIRELIEIISGVDPGKSNKEIWPGLFEYVHNMFPRTSEKSAGEFYSPHKIIELMVKTLAPKKGNIYDPCSGTGGMFREANKYIHEQQDTESRNVKFYGQELSADSVRLSTMYLAMSGIDATISIGDTFINDNLPEIEADYILTNPPFNLRWSSKELGNDKRWMYGIPSDRNANYVWIQHCLSKLSPQGKTAILLPNGSLNSKSKSESKIRRKMIEAGNIACIVALPSNLFLTTTIPVSLWVLTKNKTRKHILFINVTGSELSSTKHGHELTSESVEMISDIYHKWQNGNRGYADIPGLCQSTPIEEVVANSYSLVPSLYVNKMEEEKETAPFDEKMSSLNSELSEQSTRMNELKSSDEKIRNNRQMNRTLNEMTHAVFTEWFMHFRAPRISKSTIDSELGPIPADWHVMPLKEFCTLQMGHSFKSQDFKKDGAIGVIKIKNIRENFIDVSTTDFVDVQTVRPMDRKYQVTRNSLLMAMSGSDVGKVGLVPPLNESNELWLNQRIGMFKEQTRFGNFYLYHLLSTPKYQSILRKSAIGSAQPNISVTFINEMLVIIPPVDLIEQFGKEMYPMFEKILANNEENKKLEMTWKGLFE